MKALFKLIFLLISSLFIAQKFTADIQSVTQSGLNNIVVQPNLRSATKNNFDFLRILDSKGNEIPYFIRNDNEVKYSKSEEKLDIISKSSIPEKTSSVIILNEKKLELNQLNLLIANTDVVKTYSISGSNDQKNWFGLVYNEIVNDLKSNEGTQIHKNFQFPLNNYKYLKFEFVDRKSLPIQVISASYNMIQNSEETAQINLKDFKQNITQNKNKKTTHINIEFIEKQVINGLKFNISAPNYYLRNARVLITTNRVIKRKTETYLQPIIDFELNSKTKNQFRIGELFEKNVQIEIDNADNLPLTINSIEFFQQPISIISDLNAGEKYRIVVDSTFTQPKYDLSNFDKNVGIKMPAVKVINLTEIKTVVKASENATFWTTPIFMWICIGLALLVIGYFSIGLLKDLGKSEQ